jgi:hypothetical protein
MIGNYGVTQQAKGGTGLVVSAASNPFNIVGDTPTVNQTAKFKALGDWLRQNDGATIIFQPGTYLTQSIDILLVNNVRLVGNGARFVQPNKEWPTLRPIIAASSAQFPYREGGAVNTPVGSHLIASVSAGATSVTCLTPAHAANYPIGSIVLLYGYDTQFVGYPPNVRFFEWGALVIATDSTTGVIGLDRQIDNSYNQNWGGVPAQIFRLNQARTVSPTTTYGAWETISPAPNPSTLSAPNGFAFPSNVVVEGFDFSDCNSFWTVGNFTVIDCNLPYVNVTNYSTTRFIRCNSNRRWANYSSNPLYSGVTNLGGAYYAFEIDKFVNLAYFEDCDLTWVAGSNSCNAMIFEGCRFRYNSAFNYTILAALYLKINNCSFPDDYPISLYNVFLPKVEITNSRFQRISTDFLTSHTMVNFAMVLGSTFTTTSLTLPFGGVYYDLAAKLGRGSIIWNKVKNYYLTVTDVIASPIATPTTVTVQFEYHGTAGLMATGDKLFFYSVQSAVLHGNTYGNGQKIYEYLPRRMSEPQSLRVVIDTSKPLVDNVLGLPVWIDGYITRIAWQLVHNRSGASHTNTLVFETDANNVGPLDLGFGSPHSSTTMQFSSTDRRRRVLTPHGAINAAPGDTIAALPVGWTRVLRVLNVTTSTEIILDIEYLPEQRG